MVLKSVRVIKRYELQAHLHIPSEKVAWAAQLLGYGKLQSVVVHLLEPNIC